jgi:hypothetical protein
MIDLKQAVQAATTFARDLFVDEDLRHLRVEEVELSPDQRLWNITLGWVEPAVRAKPSLIPDYDEVGLQKLPRVYKVFNVDVESGAVQAMKMREVA